jgi:pSer/pThr/pTyr-binding forkhead associated (FHA) protein
MTEKENDAGKTGPQGTQVFEVSEINKMIAKEILDSRSENADKPALIGISNDVVGQQFIFRKSKIEIGRRPTSDIILNEASVSSMHAQIIEDNGEWRVLNLLSSNGTFVNGEKVVDQTIVPGDMVAFAGSEFVFSLVEDDEPKDSRQQKSNSLLLVGVGLAVAISALIYFFM